MDESVEKEAKTPDSSFTVASVDHNAMQLLDMLCFESGVSLTLSQLKTTLTLLPLSPPALDAVQTSSDPSSCQKAFWETKSLQIQVE